MAVLHSKTMRYDEHYGYVLYILVLRVCHSLCLPPIYRTTSAAPKASIAAGDEQSPWQIATSTSRSPTKTVFSSSVTYKWWSLTWVLLPLFPLSFTIMFFFIARLSFGICSTRTSHRQYVHLKLSCMFLWWGQVIMTDRYPVDIFYVEHLDQVWIVNWRDEEDHGVKTIQVIREASQKKKHHTVHPEPIDGHFDLVYSLFIPPMQVCFQLRSFIGWSRAIVFLLFAWNKL